MPNYRDLLPQGRRRAVVSAVPRKKSSVHPNGLKVRKIRELPLLSRLWAPKALWFGCCLALLGFAFLNSELPGHEAVFVYGMVALSFPSGILVAGAFALLIKTVYQLWQMTVPSCFTFDLLLWPFFLAAGYLQWFVLPRRLLRRASRSREQ